MIIVLLVLFGLVLGSFVNALVWRLRAAEAPTKAQKKLGPKKLSMTHGRSMCSSCHHPLAPKDLVPVLSWLSLKGKCRYCRAAIADSPLPELGLALLFALSYLLWPQPLAGQEWLQFGLWLVLLTGFMALVIYDFKWQLLPDKVVWPLVGVSGLAWLLRFAGEPDKKSALIALTGSLLIASGLFWAIYHLSKGQWIGGGDVKLGLVLGFMAAEPLKALLILFVASLAGTLAAIPAMIQKGTGRGIKLAFGPFLILGCILVVLVGERAINAYYSLIGIV